MKVVFYRFVSIMCRLCVDMLKISLILEKEYFIIFIYKIFDHPLKCNKLSFFLEIGSNVFGFFCWKVIRIKKVISLYRMTCKKSFEKIDGNYENKIMKVISYNFFICNEKLNNTFFRFDYVENFIEMDWY